MRLKVVTPERVVVDAEVTELTAPGSAGEFGVLPQHVTFLGGLDVGVLQYTSGGHVRKVVVSGGYAEVCDDAITILADEATPAEEFDAGGTREALQAAERALEVGADNPEKIEALLENLRRAEACVKALP